MEARGRSLFYVLLVLTGACSAVLALDRGSAPRGRAASAAFQEQVGGLGFGTALDLSGCACGFDPRLDGSCSASVGPLPGGACFCPRHGGLSLSAPRENADAIPPRD